MYLGLGGSDHDIAACIVSNGKIAVAIEDERVSRKKYAIGSNLLVGKSRKYCYQALNIDKSKIQDVYVDDILVETAYFGVKKYNKVNHHLAHAASCYYPSPYSESAILVVDNSGSFVNQGDKKGIETVSYGIGENKEIRILKKILGPNWNESSEMINGNPYQMGDCDDSLGNFYKIISGEIGFKYQPNDHYYYPEAGKTMGLASYGDDRYYSEINKFIKYGNNGELSILLSDGKLAKMIQDILKQDSNNNIFLCKASIAWAAQKIIEESLLFLCEYLYKTTHKKKLCFSGGVALNCVANGILKEKSPFENIFLFPACGDNGTAVGCAYYGYYQDYKGDKLCHKSVKPYFGKNYSNDEMKEAIEKYSSKLLIIDNSNFIDQCAKFLANGKVVAWFQGKSEFGPRALGHRSILADPRNKDMKDILNSKVKFREMFRPFAPAILEEFAKDYFDDLDKSPYMLMSHNVKEDKRNKIPSAIHVDGTARVQTVTKEENDLFYDLLVSFYETTGIPVLINTSFNVKGEPIVETPEDAIQCFLKTNIDILVLGKYIIRKRRNKDYEQK